ncbi:MAG: hypothetical protein GW762_03970, partial [Candidatus Pacebacteria bacterium]|nr:hypothetical protein [Candidatus Paceibacterota bacterium]
RFLAEGYAQAFKLLKANKKTLDAVSQKLVDVESLDADEFAKLMGESKTKFEYKPVLSSKISDAKVAEEKEEKRVASEKKSKKSK